MDLSNANYDMIILKELKFARLGILNEFLYKEIFRAKGYSKKLLHECEQWAIKAVMVLPVIVNLAARLSDCFISVQDLNNQTELFFH